MDSFKLLILSLALATVSCFPSAPNLQPQLGAPSSIQQAPAQSQTIQDAVIEVPVDNREASVTNHYPYQSTGLVPSSYHQPSYSGSNYGNRDVYSNANRETQGWSSNGSGWSYPYFGVSAGMDYLFSAYIGPVVWGFIAILATFGLCVGVSRFVMGSDIFGGIFQRSKDVVAGARSLDLDNITNMVYQALDTYGKYAEKQARQGQTENFKG